MGVQRTSFSKLERDRAKKAKAAAKRERRLEKGVEAREAATTTIDHDSTGEVSAGELLQRIESLHQRFEAKTITYEQFEEEKAELLARLPID